MEKLLLIDDEKDLLETFAAYFTLKGYQVLTAANAQSARNQLTQGPDLIILDVAMPEEDGFAFCREIRERTQVPIIFLSAKIDEDSKLIGLSVGGDDYLTKPVSLKELEMRVKAHLRREARQKQSPQMSYFGDLIIDYSSQRVNYGQLLMPFTKTEFAILELLTQNPQQVFAKETIYDRLWGFDKEGDPGIISEHIRRIRGKLAKVSPAEWIQTVWGVGYKWIG